MNKDNEDDESSIPELTSADFARAKPFREVFPEQFATWEKQRGRPPVLREALQEGRL